MRKLSCKWPKILTIVVLILLTCHIVASVGYGVFDWTRLFEKIIGYGIWLALTWLIYGIACLMATPSQSASPERPSNAINSEIEDYESDHAKPTGIKTEKAGSKTRMTKVLAAICIVTLILIISIGLFFKYHERTDQLSPIHNVHVDTSQDVTTEQSEPLAKVEPIQPEKETNRQPKAGDVVTNSIGMKLVYIHAGSFMMGSSHSATQLAAEYDAKEVWFMDQFPQHQVRISEGFWMGQTEVTQGQFKSIMNTEPWSVWSNFRQSSNNAASYINWDLAVEFCRKLSQAEGTTYRLPTEAEWEYACRANTMTRFSFGDSDSSLGEYGWFGGNATSIGEDYAHAIGQKKPNAFGLYDMHGNVWEWCSDWYNEDYYSKSPRVDPQGPSSGESRVLRGGSWLYNPRACRSANRHWETPYIRSGSNGFRVVCSQP